MKRRLLPDPDTLLTEQNWIQYFQPKRPKRICKLCNMSKNQFVYDSQHDNTICTNCGCVQNKSFNLIEYEVYKEEEDIPWLDKNEIKAVRDGKQNKSASYKKIVQEIQFGQQMIDGMVDKNKRKDIKFYETLEHIHQELEMKEIVKDKAESIFNNFPQLRKIKPLESVVTSVLIIAKKETGQYVNVKEISNKLKLKKLSKMVNKISNNILQIDNDTFTLSSVSKYVFLMHMDPKEEKRIRKMYQIASKQNISMGSDTLIALCLYIRMKQLKLDEKDFGIDLKYISEITNTSLNSLQNYISGKSKCTLFLKKK
jgi:transcription initiation factor TFIIIB Brf1 subunit/transcription initiation factor TFIIB